MKRIKLFYIFISIFSLILLIGCSNETKDNSNVFYTVVFESNGGTSIESLNVKHNEKINKPTDPTKEGYVFEGWYTDSLLNIIYDFENDVVTSNLILYAKWIGNSNTSYKVEHYQQNIDDASYSLYETTYSTGTTDSYSNARPLEYTGFTVSSTINQELIAADGSTSIKIFYERNSYNLTINNDNENYGNISENFGSYKFNKTVTITASPKDGYIFDGWYDGNSQISDKSTYIFNMPAKNITYTAKWATSSSTIYKVEHYQQNINDDNYTLYNTETKYGTTDTLTNASANTYAGFTSPSNITQERIKPDGSTIIKVYYTRNTYNLIVNSNNSKGGTITNNSGTYKYKQPITVSTSINTGYSFDGWFLNGVYKSTALSYKIVMPDEDTTITAKYTASKVKYTVEHYLQNANDNDYTLYETVKMNGITDTLTDATIKTYAGFTSPESITQQIINGDGSTVIKIYYDRDFYSLSLNKNISKAGTISSNGGTFPVSKSITIEATTNPGYTFLGWYNGENPVSTNPKYTFNMPAKNITYTATWIANTDTPYTVNHYQQNIDDTEYSLFETEYLAGTTEELTDATIKTYAGFTSPESITQQIINGDGTTIIKIYYDRNTYSLLVNVNNSKAGTITNVSGNYLVGKTFTIEATTNPGYTFLGWYNGENPVSTNQKYTFRMPPQDTTYTATWSANTNTTYTVKHYQQNLNDNNFEIAATEYLTGTTDTLTNAIANEYEGFVVPTTINQKYINGDGTTLIEIYYYRYKYQLSLNKNIYDAGNIVDNSGNYPTGRSITIEATTNPGYTFLGWYEDDNRLSTQTTYTFNMPANDIIYTAKWSPNADTEYTVIHYQQNVENDYYTPFETDELIGITGSMTCAIANTYVGFNTPTVNQEKINGDESTVIRIYYSRIKYNISVTKNLDRGGIISKNSGTYKYETEIIISASSNPGYTFNGWYFNNEKYATSLSFTYTVTESVTFEARWTPIKYTLVLNNQATGVSISGAISNSQYDCGESITLVAENIPNDYTIRWTRNDNSKYDGDTYSFSMTPYNVEITIELCEIIPPYTRDGDYIYFGSYPQSSVYDSSLIAELNEMAGSVPTEENLYNWTDYGYRREDKPVQYFQDIDYDNDGTLDYRGVYTLNHRLVYATNRYPGDSYIKKTYWYKYEQIKWKIVKEENGKVLIMTDKILDSQPYCKTNTEEEFEHNGGIGYSSNYELSDIRLWMNNTFYNCAFDNIQKSLIEQTLVDNSAETTKTTPNQLACNDTYDKIFLFSYQEALLYNLRYSTGTPYAYSQCLYSTTYYGYVSSVYWLRSPSSNSPGPFAEYACIVSDSTTSNYIFSTSTNWVDKGVRPVCWLTL